MPAFIYGLCTIAALSCAWMLLRSYVRMRSRLLLWSGLCFIGLSLNNLLLVIDRLVDSVDLSVIRLIPAVVGMLLLVFGLIWEEK